MTTYIKNAKDYATYVDAKTRFKIGRGEVAKVDVLSVGMRDRIRARGLLVVEQAEYDAYLAVVGKAVAVEAPAAPVDVPSPAPVVGKDMEPEAPLAEAPLAPEVEQVAAPQEPVDEEPEAPKAPKIPGYKKLMGKK